MAASSFETTQYASENFVESAGAIIFHRSGNRICLVHYDKTQEWLLAKGRINVGEDRRQAAVREVKEETGYDCALLPVTLRTRAPPAIETESHYPDMPREHKDVCEPFMMTLRELPDGQGLKVITWFIAAIIESEFDSASLKGGESQFAVGLFNFEEAVQKLKYENDREVVRKAIEIYKGSFELAV